MAYTQQEEQKILGPGEEKIIVLDIRILTFNIELFGTANTPFGVAILGRVLWSSSLSAPK